MVEVNLSFFLFRYISNDIYQWDERRNHYKNFSDSETLIKKQDNITRFNPQHVRDACKKRDFRLTGHFLPRNSNAVAR